jgi:hypothetical protein
VFFSYLLGLTATLGGRVLLDMTQFGERWIEYILMLVLTATAPYAFYLADRHFVYTEPDEPENDDRE